VLNGRLDDVVDINWSIDATEEHRYLVRDRLRWRRFI
jgi:hypothetical protein